MGHRNQPFRKDVDVARVQGDFQPANEHTVLLGKRMLGAQSLEVTPHRVGFDVLSLPGQPRESFAPVAEADAPGGHLAQLQHNLAAIGIRGGHCEEHARGGGLDCERFTPERDKQSAQGVGRKCGVGTHGRMCLRPFFVASRKWS